jgi:sporulation protein YunB
VFILILFNNKTKDILLDYAKNKIELETNLLVLNTVNNELKKDLLNYDDFYKAINNKENEIISIDYDTVRINNLLNDLTLSIINNLKDIEKNAFSNNNEVYYIPFGAITNLGTSNWFGPYIPIKIMTSGNVESSLETNLIEYGINNVMIEINININVYTNILLPYTSDIVIVNYKVPVSKKIIKGKIPDVYGGLYSTSSNIIKESIE